MNPGHVVVLFNGRPLSFSMQPMRANFPQWQNQLQIMDGIYWCIVRATKHKDRTNDCLGLCASMSASMCVCVCERACFCLLLHFDAQVGVCLCECVCVSVLLLALEIRLHKQHRQQTDK